MIDLHFVLLTKLYISYFFRVFVYRKICENLYKDRVSGVIANLCFISKDEMKVEYHKNFYRENIGVIEMFVIVKQLLYKYLDKLYLLNLRSIVPVWNEGNKYGFGNCLIKG